MSSLIFKKMTYSTLVSFCLVVLVSASSSESGWSEKPNWFYIFLVENILLLLLGLGSILCIGKEKKNKKKRNNEDQPQLENPSYEAEGLQTSVTSVHQKGKKNKKKRNNEANYEPEGPQTSVTSAHQKDTFKVENEQLMKGTEKNTIEYEELKEENHQLKQENDRLKQGYDQLQQKYDQLQQKYDQLEQERDQYKLECGWRRACTDADTVTLDADSAHPCISIENRSFTHGTEILPVPLNPQRFDGIVAVLGKDGFSSGNHYWEVDVGSSSEWDVGVARKSIQRKGNITLSPKEGFWVLGFTGRDYFAKTDPWTRITVQRKPERIGVHLRFQENKVTFFNVTDFSILFEFKACEFSEEVYPFFKNGDKGKTMHISPFNQETVY